MANEQRTVRFSGTVQGVGFRFAAIRTAERYDVQGYVKNLRDGRVECVAEGDANEIDAFLADLSSAMRGYIREQVQSKAPYTGAFSSFDVRF